MENAPKNVVIPQAVAQAIHDYLLTRPMREVEHLVAGVRQAKPAEQPEAADE